METRNREPPKIKRTKKKKRKRNCQQEESGDGSEKEFEIMYGIESLVYLVDNPQGPN